MKILLVDDHQLVRAGLAGIFEELLPEAAISEASRADQALAVLRQDQQLDLAVVDLNLPDRDGFLLLADLRRDHPALPCLVLSAESGRDLILRALDMGAVGFIPKSSSRGVMVNAVRLVLAGGTYVPPEALDRTPPGLETQPRDLADLGLTDRQLEVLALLVAGRSNKWICRSLDLAEPTVKHHVTAILRALGVTNRTEAAVAVASSRIKLPDPR